MQHQLAALERARDKPYFGYFMEQGTGKTWTTLAEAEGYFEQNRIDVLLVVAPKGVHNNWVRREAPAHLSCSFIARAWRSGAGVREKKRMEQIFAESEGRVLRLFAINIDAIIHKPAMDFLKKLCRGKRVMLVLDESSRIKNPSAARTKAMMELKKMSVCRRILSGTPITNSPIDAFAQFEFLKSGLLGTTSYRAFVAEYAEVLPPTHPLVMNLAATNPRAAHAQLIAKNDDGSPRWRNLDKLKSLITPHMFRVLKEDCLDLPPKIYKVHPFELSAKQRAAYELMEQECRIVVGSLDEAAESFDVLTVKQQAVMMKLQQITSSFVKLPTGGLMYVEDERARLDALLQIIEDLDGQFIVWARFKEELASIARAFEDAGISAVQYHGEVSSAARDEAIDSFQNGVARAFIGQAQSGGIGLTLTAADTAIYYSRDFNLEYRLQSEDRNHRIGTKRPVVYIDIIAEETIDEIICRTLRIKAATAAKILGDERRQNAR